MEVYIDNRQDFINIDEKIENLLKDVVRESLLIEGIGLDYEVSISLVNNIEIKKLNNDYREINEVTDVLSFPIEEDMIIPVPLLGDIIISIEKALEQAKDFQHSIVRELAYLTAHSMFHLMGYDHIDEEGKTKMREKEKEVMKKLKIFRENKGEYDYDKKHNR